MAMSFPKFDCALKKPLSAEEQLVFLMIDYGQPGNGDRLMEIQGLEVSQDIKVIFDMVISQLDDENLGKLLAKTGFFDPRVSAILTLNASTERGIEKSIEYIKSVCANSFKGILLPSSASVTHGVFGH